MLSHLPIQDYFEDHSPVWSLLTPPLPKFALVNIDWYYPYPLDVPFPISRPWRLMRVRMNLEMCQIWFQLLSVLGNYSKRTHTHSEIDKEIIKFIRMGHQQSSCKRAPSIPIILFGLTLPNNSREIKIKYIPLDRIGENHLNLCFLRLTDGRGSDEMKSREIPTASAITCATISE